MEERTYYTPPKRYYNRDPREPLFDLTNKSQVIGDELYYIKRQQEIKQAHATYNPRSGNPNQLF
jgi:hypothetical protein